MATSTPTTRAKPSLLKKPAWLVKSEAKSSETTPASNDSTKDASTTLFSRSADLYAGIVEDEQREQREREERRQKKAAEQERKAAACATDGREAKRRRISIDDEDGGRRRSGASTSPRQHRNGGDTHTANAVYSPSSSPPRTKATVISLDDSDEDLAAATPRRSRTLRSGPAAGEDNIGILWSDSKVAVDDVQLIEEEEEFPELAARARKLAAERERQRRSQENGVAVTQTDTSADSQDTANLPDPVIQVLITPRIHGTKPLLVKRKYRQRFKEVREAWIGQQGSFPPGCSGRDVIFAFNNQKIYDTTTIKTLGIGLDDDGNPVMPTSKHGQDEPGDKIVVVATTHALLEEDVAAERERRKRREMGELSEAEEEVQPEAEPEPPKEAVVHVVLKAKDLPEFKLKVKPDTSFQRIANVYKAQNKLPAEAQVTLRFDGEVLEPETVMKDTEIEDFDSIDVVIKR